MEITKNSEVAKIAQEITDSPEYQKRRSEIIRGIGRAATREVNPENLGKIVNRYVASGVADDTLRERSDTDKMPKDRVLELIQIMPYWIRSEENLESYRNGAFYERNNKIKEKETVIAFNKILRTIISEGQYTRLYQISKML